MKNSVLMPLSCGLAMLGLAATAVAEDPALPTPEKMWEILQAQQQEIERLNARLEAAEAMVAATEEKVAATEEKIEATEEKIEAAGDMIEAQQTADSGGDGWWQRTQLGGYGELHYNGGDADEINFHRFVLFASHDFTDQLRMQSELEVEHVIAGEGQNGGR